MNMRRQIIYIYLVFVISLFGNLRSNAQIPADYLIQAAENNPALKSKFLAYQASLERVPQMGALPDPELSFGFFIEPMERYTGNQVAEISLMQMFPWFGTTAAGKDEAHLMAQANYEAFNDAKSMLFYEIKATWYALYLLEKEIDFTRENIRILQTLEEVAISRYKSSGSGSASSSGGSMSTSASEAKTSSPGGMSGMGMPAQSATTPASRSSMAGGSDMNSMGNDGSMIDVLRIQMEINELRNQLVLLMESKIPLTQKFNALLNRSTDAVISIPDTLETASLPLPISEINENIRQNNPMIRMLEKEEEALLAKERMNRKMGFPMIGIGLQYGIFQERPGAQSMMNGQNMIMPMASITIPLWRKKYNASVQEAVYMRQSIVEERKEMDNQLLVSYEEALKDYNDAKRRADLFLNQSLLAEQAFRILTVDYTNAGTNFEEVLRMQQQILNYKLSVLSAVADSHIAVAMLERMMGR
jgi:outer membrane protein TolC